MADGLISSYIGLYIGAYGLVGVESDRLATYGIPAKFTNYPAA